MLEAFSAHSESRAYACDGSHVMGNLVRVASSRKENYVYYVK